MSAKQTKKPKSPELVLIEWVDCHGHSYNQWRNLDELKERCEELHIRSAGFLIEGKKGCKLIVPHIYNEEKMSPDWSIQGQGNFVIPNSAIRKITRLKYK